MTRFKVFTAIALIALSGFCVQGLAAVNPIPPLQNRAAVFDFDGDRKSDYAVVRAQDTGDLLFKFFWYIRASTTGFRAVQFGQTGMKLAAADYDGDGKWDIAVWGPDAFDHTPCYFYILRSSDNSLQIVPLGSVNDDPYETQDFDGDGKADPTIVRTVSDNGICYRDWYSVLSRTGQIRSTRFGLCGTDRAIRGDFDGDGKADIAVYRLNDIQNQFIILQSASNTIRYFPFGVSSDDSAVPADFDGDGKTDFVVLRTIDFQRFWYWTESSTGQFRAVQFGITSLGNQFDNPAPGDYDGDGKSDLALRRTIDGQPAYFYVDNSRTGFSAFQWGNGIHENVPAAIMQYR